MSFDACSLCGWQGRGGAHSRCIPSPPCTAGTDLSGRPAVLRSRARRCSFCLQGGASSRPSGWHNCYCYLLDLLPPQRRLAVPGETRASPCMNERVRSQLTLQDLRSSQTSPRRREVLPSVRSLRTPIWTRDGTGRPGTVDTVRVRINKGRFLCGACAAQALAVAA